MPHPLRAAIYVRQSLDRNGDGLAVARQEAECRELADQHGWDIARVYSDNDRSATNGKRPEWTRLLADLRTGMYDVLLAWHTDRLYRRLRELVDVVEIAERQALRIATVKAGDLDMATPAGRMVATMLGSAARYEMEQKGARQVASNRAAAARGVVRWTRRPYGYRINDAGKVVQVSDEAREIRRAAKRVLAGDTLTAVVADMNRRGVVTSLGGQWKLVGLRRILLNPRHAGRAAYRGQDMGDGQWTPILDIESSDRLVALLNDPKRRTAPPSLAVKYLMSGLAMCGKCGEQMPTKCFAQPIKDPVPRLVYRCLKAHLVRRLDLVDELVETAVIERLSKPDALDVFSPDVDLDRLRNQVTELRERRDGLAGLFADGLLGEDAVREQAGKLTAEISSAEREIAAATGDGPLAELVGAEDVAVAWKALPLPAKRSVIDTLMVVTILPVGRGAPWDPESVRITWRSAAPAS